MIPLPISTTYHATSSLHPTIVIVATLPWMRGVRSHACWLHEISNKATSAPKRQIRQVKFTLPITPTPFHSNELVIELKDALVEVWTALGIPFSKDSAPAIETSERVVTLGV